VIERLAGAADPGIVAAVGPRNFGFVTGGVHPAALAADGLVWAWDQNPSLYVLSPAASVIEDVAASWILEALGLPSDASVGFTTGVQMANVTRSPQPVITSCGVPAGTSKHRGCRARVHVITAAEAHSSIFAALRILGLGTQTVRRAPADRQGRMRPNALADELRACEGPTIVCSQAGHVATVAFDSFPEIVEAAHAHGAWVHVDGAFGRWAAASPARRYLVDGIQRADSWTADGHKWLNVLTTAALSSARTLIRTVPR